MEFQHVSIMPRQCIEGLNIKPDGLYADGTTGGGGHSLLIAQQLNDQGRLFCFDRDDDALAAARTRLGEHLPKVTFVKSNFAYMADRLRELGITGVDGILFDLGVSSYQLDQAERGFSYMADGDLDMRMDQSQALSAKEVVNTYSVEELTRIFYAYGEERYSKRIAENIVRQRQAQPITRTVQLSDIIKQAMPAAAKKEKQHPAKRVFQAIRIEVNGELDAVEQAVKYGIELLNPGGRIAVMSFHSLEDRIVKQAFTQAATGCICPKSFPVCICGHKPVVQLITKKALTADDAEVEINPRARSAKLRVAERL